MSDNVKDTKSISELKLKKTVKKKKPISFKKYVKLILKKIKLFFVNIWKKFIKLPSKVRYIIYIWLVVIVAILLFISLGSSSNEFFDEYKAKEDKLSRIALKYIDDESLIPTKSQPLRIDTGTLKDAGYFNNKTLGDETCEGFSVIYYDDIKDEYSVQSYINCKHYTSKEYKNEK